MSRIYSIEVRPDLTIKDGSIVAISTSNGVIIATVSAIFEKNDGIFIEALTQFGSYMAFPVELYQSSARLICA